jgi:hypothetical protein
MSLKNTGLGHVPKHHHSLPHRSRPLIIHTSNTPREFTGQLIIGPNAVVMERGSSEPNSPALLGASGSSVNSFTAANGSVPSSIFIATISDRDRWGPDTTSRGVFTSVDLSALTGIHATKRAFLPNFTYLRHVDLGPLSSVVTVGDYFLADCAALDTLDVSPLKDAKSIGCAFLARCSSLQKINLGSLVQCQSIGAEFMSHCSSLAEADFSEMTALLSLGDGFMRGCGSLREVKFLPVSTPSQEPQVPRKIRNLGASFLSNCSRLVEVDLTSFSQLKVIPSNFLAGCTALRQVNLRSLRAVTAIEGYFLWGCTSLLSVDLSRLTKVEKIGAYFLSGCSSLGSLDFSALACLVRIGCGFLSGCSHLKTVNLSGLPPLTEVESHFLAGCASLATVDLRALSLLENIEDCFLFGCRSLARLDTQHLARLRTVGHYFLSGCSALHQLDLHHMSHLHRAESFFLSDCTNLVSLDLTPVPHLLVTGGGMLDGCKQLKLIQVCSFQQLSGVDSRFLERLLLEVVKAGSAEAEKAIRDSGDLSASDEGKCVLCIHQTKGGSAESSLRDFGARSEDDHTIANCRNDVGVASARTSKSTDSGQTDGTLPPHSHDCRTPDDFAKNLVFHQQARVWALERQMTVLRSELETAVRRLGAFTSTAQKDMAEATQLLSVQKARLEELEQENAALRRRLPAAEVPLGAATSPGLAPAASPPKPRHPKLLALVPLQIVNTPGAEEVISHGAKHGWEASKDIEKTAESVEEKQDKVEKKQKKATPTLSAAPRGRSSSVGAWFTGWFHRGPIAVKAHQTGDGSEKPKVAKTKSDSDDEDHDV